MEFVDKTGEPREEYELIEAMNAVKKSLIDPKQLNPVMVHYGVILDAIKEVLIRRKGDKGGKL